MAVMIKLRLPGPIQSIEKVQALPGLADLPLDERFGVIQISPKESLYVVQTNFINNIDYRRELSPEIIEAFGDIRISPT